VGQVSGIIQECFWPGLSYAWFCSMKSLKHCTIFQDKLLRNYFCRYDKFCRHDFMHMITNLCIRLFKIVQFLIIKAIFSIYASMFTWIHCFINTSCGTCDNFCSSMSPTKFDRHVEDVTIDMPWTTMCTDILVIFYICSIMKQPILVFGNISSVKINT
jgi:hypothetical protein